MTERSIGRKIWLAVGGLGIALLLAAAFTLGSLNLPFEPTTWNQILVLYALSTFIVAALLVFGLVLTRSLLRLWAERSAGQLGARFKTKMVLGAMAISLLPVIFMFIISYALLNRTLNKWFPRPLEIATQENQTLLDQLGKAEFERLLNIGFRTIPDERKGFTQRMSEKNLRRSIELGADAAWVLGPTEEYIRGVVVNTIESEASGQRVIELLPKAKHIRNLPSGAEIWEAGGILFLASRVEDGDFDNPMSYRNNKVIVDVIPRLGAFVVARSLPHRFLEHYGEIQTQVATYEAQKQGLRAFKAQMLLTLLLFTVLLLFSATWFALFLSKQVTVPIQALAEATRAVSHGNFDHRVEVQAHDELGILVQSFNQMTTQLGGSRKQIDEFTRSLQQAVEELERRRKLMEAILENIPTGVLSLDDAGNIRRTNPALAAIFGERARAAKTLAELLGPEASRGVELLMRKSLRMGVASKELEITLPDPSGGVGAGRMLHAAVTVSSLGSRRANPGFVVVIDDLTELLRAQKAAAWQEVAQRIAHEIKNPLTPIQLSVQRLARHLEREKEGQAGRPVLQDGELRGMVGECAALIEREVSTLKSLVDEFSQFARFPSVRPAPTDLNAVVGSALDVFSGRLEGVQVRTELARELPPIKADAELLRRVLVNLIDNAAEAMEGSAAKELRIATRLDAEGDAAVVSVADSGHGISPEDKDKLFLPHFSTKDRGTGLGLAIAARIVGEHGGTICIEDNRPVGARFVIRLPLAEVPAGPPKV